MKIIKVINEKWFTTCPLSDIVDLGLREFDIPPTAFEKKDERQKRALVRQVFKQRELSYGTEFEVDEKAAAVNPFARKVTIPGVKKPRMSTANLKGQYRVVKCRLRAPDNDERWNMWGIIATNTDYEKCLAKLHEHYGEKNSFGTTGTMMFSLESFVAWATTCGWIVRV